MKRTTDWQKALERDIERLKSGEPVPPTKKEIEQHAEHIRSETTIIKKEVAAFLNVANKDLHIAVAVRHPELRRTTLQAYGRFFLPQPKRRGRLANWKTYVEQILEDWKTFDALEAIVSQGRCKSITKACELLAEDRGLYRSPQRGRLGENETPQSRYRKAHHRHTQTCFYPACSRHVRGGRALP